ncbi:MAG TPA: UDP-N-acetylmuramoyl-tripeptide--D-alanyl-D-alanine ligase [Thiotrichales bacterium]|nr:UDP-N-acetylmuramoyl-tripeptide--D-alanyl-D-alanine ligase [Thiotrichales bacterium]
MGGRLEGEDLPFRGVSTDSRTLEPGVLFVALRGERFDGHDHVAAAAAAGAVGAVVESAVEVGLPAIRVTDSRLALGLLAAGWRRRFSLPLVGVTGSNGKTTVKEMCAAILQRRGPVLATRGNLNNDIGVPLTLFGLGAEHRAAVIEMGANHPGEIAVLAGMAAPTVGVVTNAGPAHLEGFGSLEGVARAKGELFASLPPEGVAVINADDSFRPLWEELAADRRVIRFGLEGEAEVAGRWHPVEGGGRLELTSPQGAEVIRLPLSGRHNALNALAAAAATLATGASLEEVVGGLEGMTPVAGRLRSLRGPEGLEIIDDTYNANPASLRVALEVLAARPGEHWLALGDMGELGPEAERLHREAGEAARAAGVTRLFAIGSLGRRVVEAFGTGGEWFDDHRQMAERVAALVGEGETVLLVKGSRAMNMERLVEQLVERGEGATC